MFFITSNLLTAEDQTCEKFLLPVKRMSSLILLLVRLVEQLHFAAC